MQMNTDSKFMRMNNINIIMLIFFWDMVKKHRIVLYMFLTLDIKGMNDIRLISRPIHTPNHELEDTDINTPPTEVISKRIFVELLGIREESVILYGVWTH